MPRRRPGTTAKARESQLVNDAFSIAEQRIRDGTASDSLLIQVMKQGSMRSKLEERKLDGEVALLESKRRAIEAEKERGVDYKAVMNALRGYESEFDEDDDYEDY